MKVLIKVYLTQAEAKEQLGTSKPSELVGLDLKPPFGPVWRIRKAELCGSPEETAELKLWIDREC